MAEFRKDVITGEWTIIAEERAKRIGSFLSGNNDQYEGECPFCIGKEALTPKEIIHFDHDGNISEKNSDDWLVRIIPNKFPALNKNEESKIINQGIFETMGGFGLHEIVVNNPNHLSRFSSLSKENIKVIVKAYMKRVNDLKKNEKIKSIILVLNQGKTAGASIEHTHSQILALPLIPPFLKKELTGMINFFSNHRMCAMCAVIEQEKNFKERIIFEDDHFIAFTPFASKNPYEIWVTSKRHMSDFEMLDDKEIDSFSKCLRLITNCFYHNMGDPPFNYYIHTSPSLINTSNYYHWHFEFLPRLTVSAGFEMATGQYICIVSPEKAAKEIRDNINKKCTHLLY